ncbi:DNA mismatch repair protein Msh6 [Panus rudis PR-1116 ss-1]|nr:DNA mismatch repair protein Msh6 [Panus rudis PR-1116 ss-1]
MTSSKANGDKLKQKSLMSFFGKAPDTANKSQATSSTKSTKNLKATEQPKEKSKETPKLKAPVKQLKEEAKSDADEGGPKTPISKGLSQSSGISSAKYSRGSIGGHSAFDTPPTSDPIDIDMLTDADETAPSETVRREPSRKKRKKLDDSEDDVDSVAYKKGLSAYQPSPEPRKTGNRVKKQRVSALLSDDEDDAPLAAGRLKRPSQAAIFSDDEEEENPKLNAFAKKLTQFKKSPVRKGKGRKAKSDDDDDFIVPDDVDEEDSSSRGGSSRSSSRMSMHSRSSGPDDDDEEDDDVPKAKAKKSKSSGGRPPLVAESSSRGSNMFLTAAEQRAQRQKEEKKSAEDPFSFLVDVRDKDGNRPGEPGYDPRTLYIPPKAWKEFTPFEKQFWEIKQNHFDTILFFQKGKFLELYEEDARIGHQEFDLKLTQRVKMSMVGVPEMSFNFWAAKFLAKGYKVGRVDQAETALGAEMRLAADKSKGKNKSGMTAEEKGKDKIVLRELNKVYTNGTLVDEALLTDEQAGHCVSIREETTSDEDDVGGAKKDDGKRRFGVCVLDSSTSEFNLSAFEDDVCRTKLETLMRQLRPKELIFTKGNLSVSTTRLLKAVIPSNCLWTSLRDSEGLSYDKTIKELKSLYPSGDDDNEMDDNIHGLMSAVPEAIRKTANCREAVEALGSMIWYLRTLNIDKDILSMKNFNVYDPMKRGQGLVLDGQTLAHIEVLVNSEGTEDGTLLKLLNQCITPSGKRLFRIWLCMPLREVSDINTRLDAVDDLMKNADFGEKFAEFAKGLPDLERIVSRIHAKNCRVRDFVKVLGSFSSLNKGLKELSDKAEYFDSQSIPGLLRSAPDLAQHIKHVKGMFQKVDDNADEVVPAAGQDEDYDNVMAEIKGLEEELEGELKTLEKKLGCSLTYWHSAIGQKEIYLVQTKPTQKNIPKDWTKNGGTKTATRWIVPSLQPTIRSLKEARENRNTVVKQFKNRLFAEFDADRSVWLRAVRILSELDCLLSLAKSSSLMSIPKCRPEFVEGDSAWVDFKQLRHPALSVSASLKNQFIPNDVKLGGDVGRIALLTGPNMGGKSTAMRMTAAGVIMAQLGMYVPAQEARLCPVDAILTRMGAYDNMFSNASTFKVELDECCKILRDATPKSLVILDELGRGTSTYDGMAIAGAVLHELATFTLSLSFFATHYGSLTDDFAYHPNIRNMHMATLVDDEKLELVFLYKLVDGVAKSSFGTHVANLAGVPMEVVERADVISKDFARKFKEKIEGKKSKASGNLPLVAQADFAYLYNLANGKVELPQNKVRRREVLKVMKAAVKNCLTQTISTSA